MNIQCCHNYALGIVHYNLYFCGRIISNWCNFIISRNILYLDGNLMKYLTIFSVAGVHVVKVVNIVLVYTIDASIAEMESETDSRPQ